MRTNYTDEIIDEYITTERMLYAKAQTQAHDSFIKKHNLTSAVNKQRLYSSDSIQESCVVFISQYAPFMIAYLTKIEILDLTSDTLVERIGYSHPLNENSSSETECLQTPESYNQNNSETKSDVSSQVVRANYLRDTLGYTGSGIKIGIIESGLPKTSYDYLSTNVTMFPNYNYYSDHATLVASIMVGKSTVYNGNTYLGIVPDAYLYAANYTSSDTIASEFYSQVELLISNGVNIINMSAQNLDFSSYSFLDCWIDHIAINHSVHFVTISGNDGNRHLISSPAFSYNSIVVGNLDDKGTINTNDDVLSTASSYVENNGTNRPDLVAPGTQIRFGELCEDGTSFAAPIVTATIAQLCQARPALKTLQDSMKAILTASISHPLAFASTVDDEDLYDKYGAGVLDARSALYTINNNRYISSSFPANTTEGATRNYTFNVTSSDSTIRVSLSWLKYSTVMGTHPSNYALGYDISDLDIIVYDPNGWPITGSFSLTNNTEVIQFTPTTTGTYTIEITYCETSNKTTYFGLAWW